MKKFYLFFFILFSLQLQAQVESEFRSPLGIPLYISGTFAELRGNHFHGGLDIKTNGKEGYRVYAAKEGFISRIKVQAGGYGYALYVEHPNGYTTVYGHLSKFNDEITEYVKQQQYSKQSFEVDLYLGPNQFPVDRGEVIGLSGNSGSSGGPHLHYEIRKTAGQIPINPLKYTPVKDDINPTIYGLRIHNLQNGFYQSSGTTYDVSYNSPGKYSLSQPVASNAPVIGISLKAIDKLNGSNNSNGFYSLKLFVDGQLLYEYEKAEVSYGETRMLNAHIDYPEKKRGGGTYTNLFKLPGNHLNFLQPPYNDGRIWLSQYPERAVRIEVCDYAGNISTLKFKIIARENSEPLDVFSRLFLSDRNNYLNEDGIRVTVPAGALYDKVDIGFEKKNDLTTSYPAYSHFYKVASEEIPLQKFMTVEVREENLPTDLKSKAVLANIDSRGRVDVNTGNWNGDYLQVRTRNFGTYFITTDTTDPVISVYRQAGGNNYKAHSTIEFKISDNLSGIDSYRAEVDGKWILMNYDRKRNLLYHEFDGRIDSGEHEIVLTVKDNVGNSTTKQLTFIK